MTEHEENAPIALDLALERPRKEFLEALESRGLFVVTCQTRGGVRGAHTKNGMWIPKTKANAA